MTIHSKPTASRHAPLHPQNGTPYGRVINEDESRLHHVKKGRITTHCVLLCEPIDWPPPRMLSSLLPPVTVEMCAHVLRYPFGPRGGNEQRG